MKGNLKRVFQAMFMVLATVMLLSIPASAASSKTVATIGKKSYTSLEAAVKKVKKGQTIKLKKDVKVSSSLTLNRNVKYTINLNGHKITRKSAYSGHLYVKKGTVTFKNGTIGCDVEIYKNAKVTMSSIKMQSKYKPFIHVKQKGKLTIKSGTYYTIGNYGTLSIKKGTFYGVINNNKKAKMTIADGAFSNCLTNYSGTVTISGGTFKYSTDYSTIMLSNSGSGASMTIKGGTFTFTPPKSSNGTMVWNDSGAELNISGSAKFTIKNTSSGATFLIENASKGILNISGGTLENLNTSLAHNNVIDNSISGTFKMSGGTLTASGSNSYALYNSGTATLTGGKLYSKRNYKVFRTPSEGESLSYNSKVNLKAADIKQG